MKLPYDFICSVYTFNIMATIILLISTSWDPEFEIPGIF